MKVHVEHRPDDAPMRVLRQALVDVELSFGDDVPDVDVLVSGRPKADWIESQTALKALVIPFAGVPKTTLDLMRRHDGVAVHNLHHNASATAEMAVALMMAATKSIVPIDQKFRRGDWSDRGDKGLALSLDRQEALILGYGAIGRRVAATCRSLGMKVSALVRHPRSSKDGVELIGGDSVDTVMARARVVVCCLPATVETEGFMGARRIGLMGRQCVFVNVARGSIVDEVALFRALENGDLFAAGLDVWWRYPTTDDSREDFRPSSEPFHELPNVVFSPHRGGHVNDIEMLRMKALAELLNQFLSGQPPSNRVNLMNGY